ncbi:hypothetical protein SLEP1_g36066 [Rubroshorea leprosula]|uniref:Uncharacterized protein n=1 Tax=Rubroshorea leprosula TaxID=152421 RepID=A0AAV5KQU9_9ROSI|nr:hypothetical protein SLEP1_g36066 [Rubroshorea leprosula]
MEEMSYEETLSIGRGEEVVPVRQDEESEVETSTSRESVEEEEEVEIPAKILEGIDGRQRHFDEGDVVSKVINYEASWRDKSSMVHLANNYSIPSHVLLRPASEEERACPSPGDHWMSVYAHYLQAGLRFPIPKLLVGLLNEYCLGLT